MNIKSLLMLVVALFAMNVIAQNKVFAFNEIQCRNNLQQWEKFQKTDNRLAHFTSQKIDVTLDKNYHLDILTTTFLPNKGAIYLCKDELQNNVTVMLIDDDRMFVYNQSKRFLVNFNHTPPVIIGSESYAELD